MALPLVALKQIQSEFANANSSGTPHAYRSRLLYNEAESAFLQHSFAASTPASLHLRKRRTNSCIQLSKHVCMMLVDGTL